MIFRCPSCRENFQHDDSLWGKRVECTCGNKWNYPKDLDSLIASEINIDISRMHPADPPPKYKSVFDCQYDWEVDLIFKQIQWDNEQNFKQYNEITNCGTETAQETYERIKYDILLTTPVPGALKFFVKICRALNREDKKEKRYKAVVARVKLMKKVAQKHIDIIWNNMNQENKVRHTTKKAIKDHYWLITVTDEKDSQLLKKVKGKGK